MDNRTLERYRRYGHGTTDIDGEKHSDDSFTENSEFHNKTHIKRSNHILKYTIRWGRCNVAVGPLSVTLLENTNSSNITTVTVTNGSAQITLPTYFQSVKAVMSGNGFYLPSSGIGTPQYNLTDMIQTQGAPGTNATAYTNNLSPELIIGGSAIGLAINTYFFFKLLGSSSSISKKRNGLLLYFSAIFCQLIKWYILGFSVLGKTIDPEIAAIATGVSWLSDFAQFFFLKDSISI